MSEVEPSRHGGSGDGAERNDYVLPGKGLHNKRLERLALRRCWGLTNEQRQAMLAIQVKDATDLTLNARDRRLAMRAALAADAVDVTREKNETVEDTSQNRAMADLIGETLRNKTIRDALNHATIAPATQGDAIPPQAGK